MFKKSTSPFSTDVPPGWPADEFARFNAYMASTEPLWDPASDPEDRVLAPDVVSAVEQNAPPPDGAHRDDATTDAPTPQIGDNGPPPGPLDDPGPDRSFKFAFEIPEHVNTKAFTQALQDQGPFPNRLAALDQAAWRSESQRGPITR
jgi:hypothetical protein